MVNEDASSSSSWSWEQEKAFENALAIHFDDINDRWEKIAQDLPGKTVEEIKHHYELLLEDINGIDSGKVPLPSYASSSEDVGEDGGDGGKKGGSSGHGDSTHGGKGSKAEQERRKGVAWTEEEHRLFLIGLEKYGKGDWRSISRNFVISRTPTQVASHAQKYFIRLNSMNKDRRRASIHDITNAGNNPDAASPVTGQPGSAQPQLKNNGKPNKQQFPQPSFGTTMGQPVLGSAPAVGTPVSLPGPPGAHMPYGTVVSGVPMNAGYNPMPPSSDR